MSGIWPQCLHGSETCVVPKSVLKRLRTQAGRVASIAKQGVSPWLACSVGSPQLVDPEFCLLVQRLRLFRLMWRDFPDARPRMRKGLCALRSATRGVSFLLSKLRSFEWIVQGLMASDDHGRCFHLVNTPLKAVKRVLETSWLQKVGSNLTHRKDCGEIQVIDAELSKVWQRFPLGDRSLLLSQLTGVTFTRDCLAHAEGVQASNACPLCGEPDSRLHRAKYCVAGGALRASLLKELDGQSLPDHTWAYGIWDETVGLRDWQAQLCGLELPQVFTSSCEARQFVFTDGSCLFPTKPKLRLSGGAVILASPGAYQVVWAGIVPGLDQSSYWAEVLAICVAVGSFGKVTIFCDNSAVVRIAERLLRLPAWQRGHRLPHEHRDLWEYFCQVSTHQSWGKVVIRWVKRIRILQSSKDINASWLSLTLTLTGRPRLVCGPLPVGRPIRLCFSRLTALALWLCGLLTFMLGWLSSFALNLGARELCRMHPFSRWSVVGQPLAMRMLRCGCMMDSLVSCLSGCRLCAGILGLEVGGLRSLLWSCCGSSSLTLGLCPLSGTMVDGGWLMTTPWTVSWCRR